MNMQDRVIAAAEAVLAREGAVGTLELLQHEISEHMAGSLIGKHQFVRHQ